VEGKGKGLGKGMGSMGIMGVMGILKVELFSAGFILSSL
jgi:hypothetical protein